MFFFRYRNSHLYHILNAFCAKVKKNNRKALYQLTLLSFKIISNIHQPIISPQKIHI